MALFTVERLRAFWPGHPPLFSCGLEAPLAGCEPLKLRNLAADWMAVTHSAVVDLQARGIRQAYVILDDHPPMARCHAGHLNETIPAMMDELGATSIALSGYGQRRRRFGPVVRWREWTVDHVPGDELWKFPLHPALWNLEALEAILKFLLETLPVKEHTPWAFERKGGDPKAALPEKWKISCYRLCGEQMTARPAFALRHVPLRTAQLAADGVRFASRLLGGADARAYADHDYRWLDCPYDGPYPLFWSGLMTKGAINPHLARFLRATGQVDLLEVVESVGSQS